MGNAEQSYPIQVGVVATNCRENKDRRITRERPDERPKMKIKR